MIKTWARTTQLSLPGFLILRNCDIRKVCLTITLGNLAYASGQLLQQVSMDILSKVVRDNRQALEYILIEQGGPCALVESATSNK